uniref:RNA-directed DNA polymerase, eukaryota, reverse transcriptase zinc-binding domain protein n=1 Tax=Tanacetum cinerariifolium TaxID=118510 RepID=A0A6L2P184_TANCI|nr:RNA-directed DNA polymerase, eukaryota, reverse transcriptase zinc-binding domain protein [Tanacetum cinerariifolium]
MEFPRKLSSTQQADLEIDVSNEEIKKVVWDCGIDKSPGPDGFTFGMFKGVELGRSMQLSHMFYADDVIFVRQCNDSNIDTLVHVLDCFYRASGLRINMCKSKLMRISVGEEIVNQAASKIGCLALKVPFSYLGTKVGGIMSRSHSWKEIIDSMVVCLSKWKMKTLLIGGRLTLLKSVLVSMPIFYMSIFKVPMKVLRRMESIRCYFFNGVDLGQKKPIWFKRNNVLASKLKGGLGVSSLYALNRALMFKWVWRFTTQRSSLWARVIKAIHGDDGNMGKYHKSAISSMSAFSALQSSLRRYCLKIWSLEPFIGVVIDVMFLLVRLIG